MTEKSFEEYLQEIRQNAESGFDMNAVVFAHTSRNHLLSLPREFLLYAVFARNTPKIMEYVCGYVFHLILELDLEKWISGEDSPPDDPDFLYEAFEEAAKRGGDLGPASLGLMGVYLQVIEEDIRWMLTNVWHEDEEE